MDGVLTVTRNNARAFIHARAGRLVDVELGGLPAADPAAAAVEVLTWQDGVFEFIRDDSPRADRIARPTMELLLEAARLTDEATRRVALQTTVVGGRGAELTVHHGALVYEKKGLPWVFAVVGPRTYVRSAVTVKHVDGDLVTLSSGPPAGTEVVTVGAIELWGTELGIAGKH